MTEAVSRYFGFRVNPRFPAAGHWPAHPLHVVPRDGWLVVDTFGGNGRTCLDKIGHPTGEDPHVTERSIV